MSDQPNYITPAGNQRIIAELDLLQRKERPRVVQEVADAAAQGDRSENAEYIYGKKRLREIDRRIGFLSQRLKNVKIVDPKQQKGDRILFGATVDLENEDGKRVCYQIVGEDESDPANGKISWKSPVGRALLEKQAGDDVSVRRPDGSEIEYTILDFRFE
jgi:transcription elongation factor GreB